MIDENELDEMMQDVVEWTGERGPKMLMDDGTLKPISHHECEQMFSDDE